MGNVSNIIETQYMFGEKKTREEGMGGGEFRDIANLVQKAWN